MLTNGWRRWPLLRSAFISDLVTVLAERGFRRLFATRVASQTGDGIFQAGLGTYVFFNATTFPNPASAAAAFAVLYLPYSLIGPFAGVFIDRWSRRQILAWSAVIRAVFVVLTASLVASGTFGLPLYGAALVVQGVNRFFLASLSAALPHVVRDDKLVMANGVAPTAGGVMTAVGGLAALGVRVFTGTSDVGSAITMLVAAACYLLAAGVATTMARDLLGPSKDGARDRADSLAAELAAVASGLVSGARYVLSRRRAAATLGAIGGNKFFYGILFLMSILLYRNYFYPTNTKEALSHFSLLAVLPGAIGYGLAAFATPPATRRVSKEALLALALVLAGVVTGAFGEFYTQAVFVVIALGVNLAAQSIGICAVTILQEEVEDGYRGRVFAFYDMMSNVPSVAGAALCALTLPVTGKSYWMIAVVAVGYLMVSAWYWVAARQSAPTSAPGAASPSDAAQASSS